MSIAPTQKQLQVLEFLREFITTHGHGPTYSEIIAGLGRTSRGGMHGTLERLEDRGLIRRHAGKRRAIEVVDPIDRHLREVLIQCNLSDATRAELMALRVAA